MAVAVATITVNPYPTGLIADFNSYRLYGKIAVSAGPATYPALGIPLNFAPFVPSAFTPFDGYIYGQGGFEYTYDPAHGTLRIWADSGGAAQSAPLVELTTGAAIPAAVSGDTINFEISVQRQ